MARLNLATILVACVAATASGQSHTSGDGAEREVEAAEREFIDALARSDRAALERLLAEGFTFTHASGQLDTKKEYIDFAAAGMLGRQRSETQRHNEPWRIYGGAHRGSPVARHYVGVAAAQHRRIRKSRRAMAVGFAAVDAPSCASEGSDGRRSSL